MALDLNLAIKMILALQMRIRHFKDRFKRQQGAHLYLPGTFVTDDDSTPEAGAWEDWSAPSPCSRTCGGGVATQSRRCKPGYECQGPSRKYFSCSTQDCPEPADYRAQQCAEYDHIPFEGIMYEWVPYTKAPNQCELNCMPRGERFYYRHATAVIDGTRCNDEKFDVCVSGKCHPVGCDRMLGSSAREDQCRVCGGDGTSCNTFTNTIEMKDMQVGYNDILLIPAGATNIRVEELAPSNNYLAIRNKTGYYYLNGNWRIDFPKSLDFAGSRFKYDRSPQEFAAPDIITALGPTDESLFFVLLYQDSNVPISYTYSLPTNVPPPSTETYSWTYDEFTPCSATCGGGYQFRNVTCAGRNSLEPVDRSLCDSSIEPEAKRRCSEIPCQAQWIPYPWKECSAPCGDGGVQERDIFCQQIVSNGQPTLADDSECLKVEPRPLKEQKCNVGKLCAKWHTVPWKPCDHICGDGQQTRKIQCYIEKDNKIEVLKDDECEAIEPRPTEVKKCKLRPCEGVDWITSDWSGCERICGLNNETRKVYCATAEGEIYPDELCESEQQKPELVRKCESTNTTCQYLWYASQWSECSVTCGKGVQSRTVFCGVATVNGVEKVENEKCDPSKHFETLKNCTGEDEECEGEWFSGPWGKCSKPCGGGERTKKVLCIKDDEVIDPSACGSDKIVFSHEDCNSHPCSEDKIMPTDVTHSVDESEPTEDTFSTTIETTTTSGSTPTFESTISSPAPIKATVEPEEYEIVSDTNCDDGEWVEVPVEDSEQSDDPRNKLDFDKEVPFKLEEFMLNDGPAIIEEVEVVEGSGSIIVEEGSGAESTEEIPYVGESEVGARTPKPIIPLGQELHITTEFTGPTEESESTIDFTGSTFTTETTSDISDTTDGLSSAGTTNARTTNARTDSTTAFSGATESSGSTEYSTDITLEFTGSTESSDLPTSTEYGSTESSGTPASTNARTGTTEGTTESYSGMSSTTELTDSTGATESTSEITELTGEVTSATAISGSPASTNARTGSTGASTESTTELTGITETNESPASTNDLTGSTEAISEITTELTGGTKISGSPASTNARSASTAAISESTTELTGSTETSESPASTDAPTGTTVASFESTTELTGITETSGSPASTDASESTGSTEKIGSPASTNARTASTEASPESTKESTGGTETNGSPASTNAHTGSTVAISESTTELTDISETSGSPASTNDLAESTVAISETTTELTDSTKTSGSPASTNARTASTAAISESTTESTGITEISGSPASTNARTGSTVARSESTTELTGITETSESSATTNDLTGSTVAVSETTTELTDSTRTSGSPATTNARTASTAAISESTTESTGISETSGSPASTNVDTSSTGASSESTTELTGITESPASTNVRTGSTVASPESTTELTGGTGTSGSPASTSAHTGSTVGSPESTTELIGSTETSGSPASTKARTGSSTESTGSTGSTETSVSAASTSAPTGSTGASSESTIESTGITETSVSSANTRTDKSTDGTTEFAVTTGGTVASSESTTEGIEITGRSTEFTGSTTEYTGSTTEYTGSTTKSTGSTEITSSSGSSSESGSSTESTGSTTESIGSTTEFTGSTEISSTLMSTESEITGSDIFSGSTESGMTEESTYSYLYGTTPITDLFKKTRKMCKRRKIKKCRKTEYGCCWDNITPAKGPFDKGCPTPHTCKESKYGCCEDGVSPALGSKYAGCPSEHCNETLFGCCPDNKTVAEGNDYEGCPPQCLISEYGCCNDNMTEASGPDHEGCEEAETTTEASTESTSEPSTTEITIGSTEWTEETIISTTETTAETTVETTDETTAETTAETTTEQIEAQDCRNSTYRCCPDGVTPAGGPGFQGCNLPCSNSTFGCCQDGQTSAHGPSGEGCCLLSQFGCCPDNIVPARGPNGQGCGCEVSPYGCCPDNKTSAQGYNQEGCGCQFTALGCCLDNVSPAYGPDFQGCLCHTFQFGCCPDGVSIAKGPQGQGCECRESEFGCCSDEKTPAKGSNSEGCGCENSKFGCCIDGISEAKGENFEGCASSPQNLQAGCSLPKQRGTCRDFKVKWFFDMEYGGCSRFWYGGCDGNENRYNTKEECESICVKPVETDVCGLPKVRGPCEGYYPVWYYDKDLKNCAPFVYGGCLGNNNKFDSREACMGSCVRDTSADACEQTEEEGPCQGRYQRYYYDKTTGQCNAFIYGGCKGNNNNFATIEACNQKCNKPGVKKDHCSLPKMEGKCTERIPQWYFDTPENRCIPFYYSGCEGNENSFETKEACDSDCPRDIAKDTCQLPAESGGCSNYVNRWYYDTKEKSCRQFYYGGCDGNGNNFQSQQECQQRCENHPPVEPQPEPQPQPQPELQTEAQPQPQPDPQPQPTSQPQELFRTEMCFIPSETGPCRASFNKYFYDSTDGVCKIFTYGGCDGNRNNFETQQDCLQYCGSAQDFCTLPPVVGPCNNTYVQYYFDPSSDSCQPFNFGGCGGNYNRFQDRATCEQRCKRTASQPLATQAPPIQIDMCQRVADPGNCTENSVAFFYDRETSKCTPFTYTGCGGNDNRFNSEEQCERQCGVFRGQAICDMERDPGPCNGYFVKYYYNKDSGRCQQFAYGGCQGNGNRFSSNEECEQICVVHDESKPNITNTAICQQKVDQGTCQGGYHKRWYFNDERGECLAFIYSGCGGNFNSFKSYRSCLDFCRELLPRTEPITPVIATENPSHACSGVFEECTTMRCPYGVEPYVDENECNRCRCRDPCTSVECPEDEKCAIDINMNKTSSQDADFIAICRKLVKPGVCPNLLIGNDECVDECKSDADCHLHLKCCSTGCGTSCVDPTPPAQLVTQQPEPAFTDQPLVVPIQPPKIDPEVFEPEVSASLGDQATLRCAVSGNPNPRIRWSKENIEIDGTQPRYRIKLDQSLQIITLHKTDSGTYLCTADNGVGVPITNEIRLDVIDSGPRQATMLEGAEDEPPLIVSLNAPTSLNCFVLGNPIPAVTWWKDESLIPFENNEFKIAPDNSLLIHSVKLHNLGIYTCQAYNGYGTAASWSVVVKARGPYHFTNPRELLYKQFIVDSPEEPTPSTPSTTTTTSTTIPPPPSRYPPYVPPPRPYPPFAPYTEPSNEIIPGIQPDVPGEVDQPSLIVPVRANITTSDQRYPDGSDIIVPCSVKGYPTPQVQWYKDGVQLSPSEKIQISDTNTLTILQATKADSGDYQCEATNAYTKSTSTLQILVEGIYIHPSCTDNPFFANCGLIVKARFCSHKYYGKFCCRSCAEAGLLSSDGSNLQNSDKQYAIDNNSI